jgi:hypothetical protein
MQRREHASCSEKIDWFHGVSPKADSDKSSAADINRNPVVLERAQERCEKNHLADKEAKNV